MPYEEHVAPFYGTAIAELQFADSDIYYSEPAMLMYYNDALSSAAQVLAPLRVLLEIVLANHEPTDEVEGILPASACNKTDDHTVYGAVARYVSFVSIYAEKMGIHVDSMGRHSRFTTMPSTLNIWMYPVYDKSSHKFSRPPTYVMSEMWS